MLERLLKAMTKEYRIQMMIAKPHEAKLSAEVMVALADMRGEE